MKLPSPRFTVRRLMIAVAVVGLLAGIGKNLSRRSMRFKEIAQGHRDETHVFRCGMVNIDELDSRVREAFRQEDIRVDFHARMAEKYERAARYPWLPVEPDPPDQPEPK
jgi:hypothetical protein